MTHFQNPLFSELGNMIYECVFGNHTWSSFLVLTFCQCYGTNAHLLTLQDSHANNTKNNKIEHTITSLRSVSVHMPTTQTKNQSFRPYCVVTVFACKCACVFQSIAARPDIGSVFFCWSAGTLISFRHMCYSINK